MRRQNGRVHFSTAASSLLLIAPVFTLWTLLCPASMSQQAAASPKELVRQATENELNSPFVTQNCTYQYHREASGKEQTLLMIKSSDLVVGKLVRSGGVPLSQDEEHEQNQHLSHLLHSTHEQEEQRKQQQKFERDSRGLIGVMPDAFLFTQTGSEIGANGHQLIHFSFLPAPDFKPLTIEQQLLRGLTGILIIDESDHQIVRLEANLFRDVDFGFGVLVHLNKGGQLLLDRVPGGGLASGIRSFAIQADGRLLLLKKIEIHRSFDHFSCFDHTLSLAAAIAMLTTPNIASIVPY